MSGENYRHGRHSSDTRAILSKLITMGTLKGYLVPARLAPDFG